MKKASLGLMATFLVISVAFGLGIAEKSCASDAIRIGFVADVSGIGAAIYKGQKAGMDLFIEEVNASGGVLGRKLELVVRDAQLKPDVGANIARELILNEKCDFLMGGTSSGVALAVTRVANELKKIICFHTSNGEALTTTDFQPYMYQVVPNTGIEGRGIALFLSQKPYRRYGYIGPDYAYAHTQWESFKKDLTRLNPNVEILDPVWVKLGETNYSPYIPNLMAKNAEMIYSSLWGGGLSSFVKQARPFGLFQKSSVTSIYDLTMLKATGSEMPEGLLGYTRCPFYAVDTPQMDEFVRKYREKFKEWPDDWAIFAYDGLVALTDAIKKANSTDSDQVVRALEGLRYNSLTGERYIRPEDHQANVGIYVGYTGKDPKFPDFLILKDVVEVPAEKVWLSVEEVKKLQPQKK